MKKLLPLVLLFSLITGTYAQNSAVIAKLKEKFPSVQWRKECKGWYLLSYNEGGTNLFGFADLEGNVIVSNATQYKVHPGYVEMQVLDMLKLEAHKQWQEDMKQYQKDYNKYLAVEQDYKNKLDAYNEKRKIAENYATEVYNTRWKNAYNQFYQKYKAEAEAEQRKQQQNQSGGVLGAILSGISSGLSMATVATNAKNAANNAVNYNTILNEVLAARDLTTEPYKEYNPMPTKPAEPSTGLEWKSYPLMQPCPYTGFTLSSLAETGSTVVAAKDNKYGVIDASFKEVVPFNYDGMSDLGNNYLRVSQNGLNGVIDLKNKQVIEIAYDKIEKSGELLLCHKGKNVGIKNFKGETVLPVEYESIISEKDFVVCKKNGLKGIYSSKFLELYPCQFQEFRIETVSGTALLFNKIDGLWGVKDYNTGNEIMPNKYTNISKFTKEGYMLTTKETKVGLYSIRGKMVLPCEYTKIEPTDNGNLKTEKNGLVGLHDQNGIELIPNEYTSIQPLKDTPHIYIVEKNKKYGIRYLGRDAENIPCKYDGLTLLSKINAFNAKENSNYSIIDFEGNNIVGGNKTFTNIINPQNDYLTYCGGDGKYYAADYDGNTITKGVKYSYKISESVEKYKKKNSITPTYERAMTQTADAKKRADLLYEKSNANRGKFSFYAKNYVERIINDWQTKGEFEKVETWKKRVNEETRQQKVYALTKEAQDEFVKIKEAALSSDNLTLTGAYDSEHETYQLKSNYSSQPLTIKVPLGEAQDFKNNFSSMKRKPIFSVKDDDIALTGYIITSNTGAVYKYADSEALTHSIAKVDYNFNKINLDGISEGLSTSSMILGTSDVDINIPETGATQTKTFAIIIANEKYDNEKSVQFAYNDGSIFKEYCTKTLGIPQQNIHFVANATLNQMRQQFNWIEKAANEFNGEARFIVYYAGHGFPDDNEKDAYMLPSDGDITDLNSSYKLSDLYSMLGEIAAKDVLVFMDACFSGSQRSGENLASARGVSIKPRVTMPTGNLVVFSAVTDKQTAYPYTEKVHGLFTYYILKKLQGGDSHMNLGELHDYVSKEVGQHSIVVNSKAQNPTITASPAMTQTWRSISLY